MHPAVVPNTVIWAYAIFGAVFAVGIARIWLRHEWSPGSGWDKFLLLAPLCYAAPVAAFGTEHFTLNAAIAAIVPRFIPWHLFWTDLIGAGFLVGGFSLATGIGKRYAAAGYAFTFFCFVVLMDAPAFVRHPSQMAFTGCLRELAFCGGPLALAASLCPRPAVARAGGNLARWFIAIPLLWYSWQQFVRFNYVPGVPLEPLTPAYIPVHALWTILAAIAYAIGGILLALKIRPRMAAAWAGAAVILVELVVYVPIAVVNFRSLDNGFNYLGDTLLFGGTVLLLAAAMPSAKTGAAASGSSAA